MTNIFWVLLVVALVLCCWTSASPVSKQEAEFKDLLSKSFDDSDYTDVGGEEDMDTAANIIFRPLFRYRVKRSNLFQR